MKKSKSIMQFNWKKILFCSPENRTGPHVGGIGPADDLSVPPLLLYLKKQKADTPFFIVFDNFVSAENAKSAFDLWAASAGEKYNTLLLPDGVRNDRMASISDCPRAKILHKLLTDPPDILFASAAGVLNPVPSVEDMKQHSISLHAGQEYSLTKLAKELAEMDYDDEVQVSVPGEFSRRGGLLDVFSPSEEFPARIEFFGDEIESIRLFSPATQRSLHPADSYEIILRTGSVNAQLTPGSINDYTKSWAPVLIPVFPDQINAQLRRFAPDRMDDWEKFANTQTSGCFSVYDAAGSGMTNHIGKPPFYAVYGQMQKIMPEEEAGAFSRLGREWMQSTVRRWLQEEDYRVVLLPRTESDEAHFRTWIEEAGLQKEKKLILQRDVVPCGLFAPEQKTVLLTEQEIFAAPVKAKRSIEGIQQESEPGQESDVKVDSAADLEEGDYAVHLNYGVCIYRGLHDMTTNGSAEEMIELEFARETILRIPLRQAHLLTRYIGAGRKGTSLNVLNSSRWGKAKTEALLSVRNLAFDMLRMQAMRQAASGIPCPADGLEQRLFERAFPFQETADQLRSMEEIKKDMESAHPMDRLLCGDVGYGKTELAMRAAFKCVASGKQVAVLVPTTVLAQQHYYSFAERFAGTPVIIEQLSRFRTKAQQGEVLRKMEQGLVDIVIGTHRLVQEDVKFKNLGLVVIDEEQRFGVIHKERLKKLRANVDVLTMTATPIPRTLYMSMSGMRDMSTLMSAPVRRMPIQTLIVQEEPSVIHSAIARELERGGQVYFVHNRVKGIESVAEKIQTMFPDAKIGIGHGQMPETELENVMSDFIEGKIQILVCTTIIESGLDIPNANTIIIDRADRFGLAELYQLRGRVGRWTRQAYAYLLLPRSGILTGDARKRIAAMRRYTHLGAGFNLAMSDLQIRGAGNILGAEQSGQINAIGFHLYCELLRDFTSQIQKKDILPPRKDTELHLDFLAFAHTPAKGKIGAALPKDYVNDPKLRFRLSRRLSLCRTEEEIDRIEEEMRDRFGRIPVMVKNLLLAARICVAGSQKNLDSISVYDGKAVFEKGHTILKPDGFIPRMPDVLTPQEKLSRLYNLIREKL